MLSNHVSSEEIPFSNNTLKEKYYTVDDIRVSILEMFFTYAMDIWVIIVFQ